MDFEGGFGLQCVSSDDEAARSLCGWLIENTSMESRSNLPVRVLECWGYRFPRPIPSWGEWRADVSTLLDERWLTLEVDLTEDAPAVPAVRLSSFAEGEDEITAELPKLRSGTEPRVPVAGVSRGYWND
ncbi:MAG: hypothetical protein A2623_10520 [Caulobacterales bacterium RIFCSPHIGHO2_01_FULL_70_19]|nr:MAG: hypothetical protein A2623_10520 [Caulobacterales bacterium RIFCSPHIGHO2_01_FULL_70_19]